jgi:hypothetical protein
MLVSTSFQSALVRPGSEIGVLFPAPPPRERFLVLPLVKVRPSRDSNEVIQASPQNQHETREDVLVRLPSLRESKGRVSVLQRWVGRVENVKVDRFLAVLVDATNSRNPLEQVELDLTELSESDLPLLVPGATFYWSIGYRDTPEGQRERISALRFARQPRLSKTEVNRIFEQADQLAAFLESD